MGPGLPVSRARRVSATPAVFALVCFAAQNDPAATPACVSGPTAVVVLTGFQVTIYFSGSKVFRFTSFILINCHTPPYLPPYKTRISSDSRNYVDTKWLYAI